MSDRIMATDKENYIQVTALRRTSVLLNEIECEVSIQRWTDNFPPTPSPYLTTSHRAICETKESAFFYANAIASETRLDVRYCPLVETTESKGGD